MRRKDREVLDFAELCRMLDQARYGHLSLVDPEDHPYGVTLNFGWELQAGQLLLYFHAATEGRKLDCLRHRPEAWFFVESDCRYEEGFRGAQRYWTTRYRSVAAGGTVEFLESPEEKSAGLAILLRRFTDDPPPPPDNPVWNAVSVFRLRVHELTGKRNLP